MKFLRMKRWTALVSALVLGTSVLQAQETNEVEQLKRQLRQMQENFDRAQREQKQQIEALTQKLDALARQQAAETEKKKLEQELAASLQQSQPPASAAAATVTPSAGWSPTAPIRIGRGGTYMDISLDGLFAAGASTANDIEGGTQLGGHDPNQRGFTVENVELTFSGAVDPYFRAQANVVLQLDSGGESFIELEEAYAETTSLPWNLQVKAGQFFTEFGRLNPQHPHSWSFVDQPLVNGRFLGPDGLRNPGARISWLAPTPFYSELFFAVQNSHGETAFSFRDGHEGNPFLGRLHDAGRVKAYNDLLFAPRYAASFDLTDTQTLLAGISAAFGPNGSGATTDTQVYGVDLYWKWKSANAHGGFPFVSFQTEAMLRRYQLGAFSEDLNGNGALDLSEPDINGDGVIDSVPRETITDWGWYGQVLYGFRKGWVAGLRGDYVAPTRLANYEAVFGPDPERLSRWRISPNLTWYPSEFSKIRLQYNYDDRRGRGIDHSVWLQFEFLLGAHAAHKF